MCNYIYDFISLGWGCTALRWLIVFLKTSIFPRLNQHGRILLLINSIGPPYLDRDGVRNWHCGYCRYLMHLKSIIYTGATNTTIKKMRYFNHWKSQLTESQNRNSWSILQQIFRQRKKIVVYTCICLQY